MLAPLAVGIMHGSAVRRSASQAVAEVDDARSEGAAVDELEVDATLVVREEGPATAYQHRVDPHSVLIDELSLPKA
jgi:hypothetical protein